jgi:hypothetical protein
MCLCDFLANPDNHPTFTAFLEHKFGYGRWNAPFWFIGMEEGGGKTCAEVLTRIQQWRLNARLNWNELNDLHSFWHRAFHPLPLEDCQTWRRHRALVCAVTGQEIEFARWGKKRRGEVCLVEINPLPSPNLREWHYPFVPVQDEAMNARLANRDELLANQGLGDSRAEVLRQRLEENVTGIRCVVFYGRSEPYLQYFNTVVAGLIPHGLAQIGQTAFRGGLINVNGLSIPVIFAPHPRNGWWNQAIGEVAAWINNNQQQQNA